MDPARQDVDWPIRFVENMIMIFSLHMAGVQRGFWEVDLPIWAFSTIKKVSLFVKFLPLCLHGQHL